MRRFRDGWLGRVHIGTTLTALMYELPPVLRELRSAHPRIDLVVTNMATRLCGRADSRQHDRPRAGDAAGQVRAV